MVVGGVVLALGAGLRLWPGLYAAQREESAVVFAVCLVAVFACSLAWPERDFSVRLGWTPAVLGLGLALSGLALVAVPSGRPEVLPRVLELVGGAALVYGMSQRALGRGVRQRLRPRVGPRTKVQAMRHDGRYGSTPASGLEVGQRIRLDIDAPVPVDVVLVEGTGFAELSAIHGHAAPVAVEPGQVLLAGSVPRTRGLVAKVKAPHDGSFQSGRVEAFQRITMDMMAADGRDRLGGVILLVLTVAAGAIPWLRDGPAWDLRLLASASVGLAVAPALPLVAAGRTRVAALKVLLLGGLVIQRGQDVMRLLSARRTFIDPMLLSAPGDVEALSLTGVPPERLVMWAASALTSSDGPERQAVRAWLEGRGHPQPEPSALKHIEGVYYASVEGRRVLTGSLDALRTHAGLRVSEDHQAGLRFLGDRRMRILGVATATGGLQGLLGIRIRAREEVKQAALSVSARLGPGLEAEVRRNLAQAAELSDRATTPRRSDVLWLRETTTTNADCLHLRVLEPYRRARWVEPPGAPPAGPKVTYDGLVRVPVAIATARHAVRAGRWRGVLIGTLAALVVAVLAYTQWLEPVFAALLATSALALASSELDLTAPSPEASA
jgi:hypothetical protein